MTDLEHDETDKVWALTAAPQSVRLEALRAHCHKDIHPWIEVNPTDEVKGWRRVGQGIEIAPSQKHADQAATK